MLSMTGFGSAGVVSEGTHLQVQVRSVNSRFFEVRSHLPKEYLSEEADLKAALGQYFQRGHVDLFVHRKVSSHKVQGKVEVHGPLLKSYLSQLKKAAKEVGMDASGALASVGNLPHLVTVEVQQKVGPTEKADLLKALHKAAEQCKSQRKKEGTKLARDLSQNFKQLQKLSVAMERARKSSAAHMAKLRDDKFKDLQKRLSFDQSKLLLEMMNLDKLEIAEELVRLRAHVDECLRLLTSGEPVGKRLDFFAQELLREVNTVGSKSQDSQLTKLVVEAKTVIEKLREQVQNIE